MKDADDSVIIFPVTGNSCFDCRQFETREPHLYHGSRNSIPRETREMLGRLLYAFDALLDHHRMSTRQAAIFFALCEHQGQSVTGLAQLAGATKEAVSRLITDLGEVRRDGAPGPNLLTVEPRRYGDRREHLVYLTSQGIIAAQEMIAAFKDFNPKRRDLLADLKPARVARAQARLTRGRTEENDNEAKDQTT